MGQRAILYKHLQGFEVGITVYQIYPFETDFKTLAFPAQVITVSAGKQALFAPLMFDHLEPGRDDYLTRIGTDALDHLIPGNMARGNRVGPGNVRADVEFLQCAFPSGHGLHKTGKYH